MEKQTNKLTPSAIMEKGVSDYVVGLQALLKIIESPCRDSVEVNPTVNVISNGIQSEEEVTLKQVELEDRASDLREIWEYFTALEEDRRNLQQLLLEQREEHGREVRALERELVQERAEWQREKMEREEALLSAVMPVVVIREKLMKELRSQTDRPVSTKHLGGTAVSKYVKLRKWWCKNVVAPQDAHSSSASQIDLKQIMELEINVRKAEEKKQLKTARKADRSSGKKEGKKTKRDEKVKDIKLKRYWHCYLLTMGCATSPIEDWPSQLSL